MRIFSFLFRSEVIGNRREDDVVLVVVAHDKFAERRTELEVTELLIFIVTLQFIFCAADTS